ncbi:hypothetical protein BDV96DRAFT_652732 [Lophiotrema nucula]|uniref:Heterokaryon incompatibility domain-containing protein n=1 Tax=Lophiotrema nucula TaxID=690887 RepID=A0A6A5YN30_9PLEO|nr:hypothetical protein BDV96DRAFT_652732 [Lophiotrema nucula]
MESNANAESQIDTEKMTSEWFDLVEMYSNCGLTKEQDKLIAISGMAQRIQRLTGQTYCAGIWADTIAKGLLWLKVEDSLLRPKRPRAPSWSWAAYDGPIPYLQEISSDCEMTCSFRSLRVNKLASEDTSFLQGLGRLEVSVPIVNLRNPHTSRVPVRTGRWAYQGYSLPAIKLRYHVSNLPMAWNEEESPYGYIAKDECEGVSGVDEKELFFMSVGHIRNRNRTNTTHYGVFLNKVEEQRSFRRIGFGEVMERQVPTSARFSTSVSRSVQATKFEWEKETIVL